MSEGITYESVGKSSALLHEHAETLHRWKEFADAAKQLEAARDALESINGGLNRETHRFSTPTGNTKINVFSRDPMGGAIEKRSSINLVGGHTKILGDHLEEVDGQLVLFDTEIGYGFSVFGARIESVEELTRHDSFRVYSDFLEKVSESPAGVHTDVDCMYS